ncbi:MAG TPA: hypothetical protein PLS03_10345 [Terrimicrobiaceae bacterium]|nr:hypothetical protein [Terrimicrobiaceae bacterium]
MNPLPAKILVPTTANRIPWTENAQGVVARLLDFQINASAFLMDARELEDLQTEDFVNDFDRAFEDFFYQIPKELRWKVFPVEVKSEDAAETAPITDGRTNASRIAR